MWYGLELFGTMDGGHRNVVYRGQLRGQDVVIRRTNRSKASVAWELDLMEHLAANGVRVPRPIRTRDGRRDVDGVVVQEFLPGREPADNDDWRRVASAIAVVHELTVGWPQRPGSASARELMHVGRGGDVRLDAMPVDAVRDIRQAWRGFVDGPQAVVHGDIGVGNVRIDATHTSGKAGRAGVAGSVGLLDWDEARVDVPWFDVAAIPEDVPLDGVVVQRPSPSWLSGDRARLYTAAVAWETATCWVAEPAYAAGRLAELRSRLSPA